MRRASLFLTMLVLAALLLAACGGEGTATSVPGTEEPTATAEATSTSDVPTPTAEGTLDLTITPAVPVTGEESPSRLTNLMDYGVWNQNGEQIGNVDDMVLDFDNSNIAYVVVGSGGFLGLGEKEVLVPWDMLELQTAADNTTGGENAFLFTGNQEYYNNAPDTDVAGLLPEMSQPAADDWDADIRNFWSTGVVPGTTETTGTETPVATEAAAIDATATATLTLDGQGQAQAMQGLMLASDLLGSTIRVVNNGQAAGTASPDATATSSGDGTVTATAPVPAEGTGLGIAPGDSMDMTIEDAIINPESGEILYLVVNGAFTDGDRLIPVPVDMLRWDPVNQTFSLGVYVTGLENAPVFEGGEYPDFSAGDWSAQFVEYWNNLDDAVVIPPAGQ